MKMQVEKAFCINFERRADRWDRFLQNLPNEWPFGKIERVIAVDGENSRAPDWWSAGNYVCKLMGLLADVVRSCVYVVQGPRDPISVAHPAFCMLGDVLENMLPGLVQFIEVDSAHNTSHSINRKLKHCRQKFFSKTTSPFPCFETGGAEDKILRRSTDIQFS